VVESTPSMRLRKYSVPQKQPEARIRVSFPAWAGAAGSRVTGAEFLVDWPQAERALRSPSARRLRKRGIH